MQNFAKITKKLKDVYPTCGVSQNCGLFTLLLYFGVCVDCIGFICSFLNKLLKYGFVGCLCLLLKFVQVQMIGSETLGGSREPHSNSAKQV